MTRKEFLSATAAFAAAPMFAGKPEEIRAVLLHWGLNMWGESLPPDVKKITGGRLCHDKVHFSDEAWNLDPEQGLANLRGGICARVGVL